MIWFQKMFKLIFQKQPSCPRNRCTEYCRKLPNLTAFLEMFLYLFCRKHVKRFANCAIHLFPRKNKVFTLHLVDLVVLNLYFYLVLPF